MMSALSESASDLDRRVARLLELLHEELAPYPGRGAVVARIVISSVIVMVLVMTFRIPGAALGGYYTLLLSRESPHATLAGGVELIASFCAGVVYVLLSALLFFGSPVLHFLWVVGSFFLVFFVMRVLRSYSAAAAFGFVIVTCIPIWERVQPSEFSVEATLWTTGSVALGTVVTIAVEYVAAPFRRHGVLESGLLERWRAVTEVLRSVAEGRYAGKPGKLLTQFAAVGVSRLRRFVMRSGRDVDFIEKAGALVSTTEHLVDLTASMVQVGASARHDESRLLRAADELEVMTERFAKNASGTSGPIRQRASGWGKTAELPFLPEIERNIELLEETIERRGDSGDTGGSAKPETEISWFLQDAWTNHDHLRFALKGCLAATICYVTYSAIDWPGLNTSVATCLVTALSSIGSSRQKQILRIGGAITGGVIFGMGAQVFLLPYMDSITAFTVFFAIVTAIAAWISTASARLSYFGLQIALGFFLINLQDFAFQTSLSIARDRVFGILLGLLVMWLVFDLLGGVPAANQMLARFRATILRLAELEELALAADAQAILRRVQEIREELVGSFAAINTEADAVLLETGPERGEHMVLRERILALLPALRSLLLLQVTLLQYRRQRLISQLPPAIATAQQNFHHSVAGFLRELAMSYPAQPRVPEFHALDELHQAIQAYYSDTAGGVLSGPAVAILSLSESITSTIESIELEGHAVA